MKAITYLIAALLLTGAATAANDFTTGLILHYPFTAPYTSHTEINDSSPSGMNADVVKGDWDEVNRAWIVNGSEDVQTFNTGKIGFTGGFTASVWVYPTAAGGTPWSKKGGGDSDFILGLNTNLVNDVDAQINNATNTMRCVYWNGCVSNAARIPNNDWSLYTVAVDYTQHLLIVYVNGEAIGNVTFTGNVDNTANFRIGSSSGSFYFTGSVGDLRLYNRTMNASTINALYTAGRTGPLDTTVTANFSTNLSLINDFFYGVSSGYAWGSAQTMWYDSNGDGSLDAHSNATWHREKFDEGGIRFIRIDSDLNRVANSNHTFNTTGINRLGAGNIRDVVEWAGNETAAGRPTKVLVILSYMPSWLAASNAAWCSAGSMTCPPSNYTRWEELITDWMNYTTQDHAYDDAVAVEVWNEPSLTTFWMNNLHQTNNITDRIGAYNTLYNHTADAVRTWNASIDIAGPAGAIYTYWNPYSQNWVQDFCQNNTVYDAVSFHVYPEITDGDISSNLDTFRGYVDAYCRSGVDIWVTEWNYVNSNMQVNQSDTVYAKQFYQMYDYMLSSGADRYRSMVYDWMDVFPYNYTARDGWPYRWDSVYEQAQLYTPYNITANLSTYHSTGSQSVNTSTDTPSILSIASNNGSAHYVSVFNSETDTRNLTIAVTGLNVTNLTDVSTGTVYPVVNGSAYIGLLTAYELRFYSVNTPPAPTPPTPTPTPTPATCTAANNAINFLAGPGLIITLILVVIATIGVATIGEYALPFIAVLIGVFMIAMITCI